MYRLVATVLGALLSATNPALAADQNDVVKLLTYRECADCNLTDADLIHADLRDANLKNSSLQRANLSQANLDGANLRNANLSFTTLHGASLRGADLRGSQLYGTDLRHADLSGALLDSNALEESHWQGSKGIATGIRSHAVLHNAGVDAAQAFQWKDAEQLFSKAIEIDPGEPLSWVARGISRGEQGNYNFAAKDLAYAGILFQKLGNSEKALQLKAASERVATNPSSAKNNGNGVGSSLLSGTLSILQSLGPIALKTLIPMIP